MERAPRSVCRGEPPKMRRSGSVSKPWRRLDVREKVLGRCDVLRHSDTPRVIHARENGDCLVWLCAREGVGQELGACHVERCI